MDDLALVLPLIAGPDGVDPHVAPVPLRDPARVDVAALRVAFHTDNGIATPTDEIRRTVRRAAEVLESAGARVGEGVPPGLKSYDDATDAIWMGDGGAWARRILDAAGTIEPSEEMAWGLDRAPDPQIPAAELTRLLEVRDRFRSAALAFWSDHDVLLCPVNARAARGARTGASRSRGASSGSSVAGSRWMKPWSRQAGPPMDRTRGR